MKCCKVIESQEITNVHLQQVTEMLLLSNLIEALEIKASI